MNGHVQYRLAFTELYIVCNISAFAERKKNIRGAGHNNLLVGI